MSRRRYLVTYDVADDRRRAKVHRTLRDHGDPLQMSVFRCDLNEREVIHLRAALHELVHHGDDQVLVVDLGPADATTASRVSAIGRPYAPEPRARIV
jgi:CRISPR-associated protein Cas2